MSLAKPGKSRQNVQRLALQAIEIADMEPPGAHGLAAYCPAAGAPAEGVARHPHIVRSLLEVHFAAAIGDDPWREAKGIAQKTRRPLRCRKGILKLSTIHHMSTPLSGSIWVLPALSFTSLNMPSIDVRAR